MELTVKQARQFAEKTQIEMAIALGIHVQTYRKIEKDPNSATVKQAKQISEITRIPYDQIFFGNKSTLSRLVRKDIHRHLEA